MKHIRHNMLLLTVLLLAGTLQTQEIKADNRAETQKVINVIGDSYVANHRRSKEESWHYKFAKAHGYTYNNYGRNGNCVAFDRKNWGKAMMTRYKDMDQNADLVVLIAGHNDAVMIGNNKDSLQMFTDSLDVLLTRIKEHCPKARIAYVTPWYVDRDGFYGVCHAIKKICKRHHVPVLWNYSKKNIIKVRNAEFRKKYFQGNDDTAHLNAAGHDMFLKHAERFLQKVTRKRTHPCPPPEGGE